MSAPNPNAFLRAPFRNLEDWTAAIVRRDARAVAQAITAVENTVPLAGPLLRQLFPHTGRAVLIGVTGAPGAGKSTLVDAIAAELRKRNQTVAVLAVDPTSPYSGGAILADRIRMQDLASDAGIFVRSMATRGQLGGVAAATLDAAMILDAAGFEIILIETVGVGQDEIEIARIADSTLLLLTPATGDDVQTLKAGVMEIADVFVLNKCDLPGIDPLESAIREAMSLAPATDREPAIVRTAAHRAEGVEELLTALDVFLATARSSGSFAQRRNGYWRRRIPAILQQRLLQSRLEPASQVEDLDRLAADVAARKCDPYTAADQLWGGATSITLDHLGVAVDSLSDAVAFYRDRLGLPVSGYEVIASERTKVAMLPAGESRIELLEATAPDSPIADFLAKRGPGLHHICLRVPDLASAIQRLKDRGVRLTGETPGTGAGGHKYIFVHPSSTGGVLLELVEAAPAS